MLNKRRTKTHMERDDDIDFLGPESSCPPPLSAAAFFFTLDAELVNDIELLLDEDPPPWLVVISQLQSNSIKFIPLKFQLNLRIKSRKKT